MPRRRFAIITYEPTRIGANGDGQSFPWIVLRGLQGYDCAKERSIINITLINQLPKRSK